MTRMGFPSSEGGLMRDGVGEEGRRVVVDGRSPVVVVGQA